jgi:hypothetical protein
LFFKDDPQLASLPVEPGVLFKAPLPVGTLGALARTYNRLGGLIERLAAQTGIDPVAVLAVWYVESGGQPLIPGRPVLRFENHKFFDHWGAAHTVAFDAHFQFGGHAGIPPPKSKGHKFRSDPAAAWQAFHGSQVREYEVFNFAKTLSGDEEAACQSASYGGPQILGSNYGDCGYSSAIALFQSFGAHERWHVLGFFDFCKTNGLLKYIIGHQWVAFGERYNGDGATWGAAVDGAYALKPQLEALPRGSASPPKPLASAPHDDGPGPDGVLKPGLANDSRVARAVAALARRGYRDPEVRPELYDDRLKSLVSLYQGQNVDVLGRPLGETGLIDPLTWSSLMGAAPVARAPVGVTAAALAQAISQVGVMEVPLGSNSGPKVDLYLASVGLDPGNFWCMAFVYWCFREAAASSAQPNPFPRTGGCLDAWDRTPAGSHLSRAKAIANPALVRPGMVFILDYGNGHGHTGFVKSPIGGALTTVEGNTSAQGSGNGVGVFELSRRSVSDSSLKGFIDLTGD